MWNQANSKTTTTLPPTEYGWTKTNGCYSVQYDTEEHVLIVRQRVSKYTRGCNCKSGCNTKTCGCLKSGQQYGPGCRCVNCSNILTSNEDLPQHSVDIGREVDIRNESESESETESDQENE